MEERLFTFEEVADYCGVSVKTILRETQRGKLKAVKVGRQWRIKPEDLDEYLKTA